MVVAKGVYFLPGYLLPRFCYLRQTVLPIKLCIVATVNLYAYYSSYQKAKLQFSQIKKLNFSKRYCCEELSFIFIGDPGAIRTRGLRLRRSLHYPTMLRSHMKI